MLVVNPLSGDILDANPAACSFYGYSRDEFVKKSLMDIVIFSKEQILDELNQITNQKQYVFLSKHRLKDGTIRDVEVHSGPVTLAHQKLLYSIVHDITERKRTEEILLTHVMKYRRMFENIQDVYFEINIDGFITEITPSIKNVIGMERELLIGKSFDQLCMTHQLFPDLYSRVLQQKKVFDYELTLCDVTGLPVYCSINAIAEFDNDGIKKIIGSLRNISERKKFEKQLIEAKKQWERTFDAIDSIITIQDADKRIIRANHATTKILQKNYGEIIGKHCFEVLREEKNPCENCPITSGNISDFIEYHHATLNKTFQCTISMTTGEAGGNGGFVIVAKDITRQREIEQQLRHTIKMEALGTLAGGIAHDFNNILSSIIGFTELILEDVPKNVETYENAQEVLAAAYRAKDLVSRILTFSRKGEQRRELFQIGPLIKECVKFLRASLPSTIDIRFHIPPDLCTIIADPTQIHQVIMNLCANASHAMRKSGGILTINLSNVKRHEILEKLPLKKADTYLKLSVEDTGHGISPDIIDKIFDPYFTTKEKGEGTGLGLSVVHGIVQSHGGAITVHSEPRKGAVFNIYLPATIEHQKYPVKKPGIEKLIGGSERILFVDDEITLASLATKMLESLGYKVVAKTSSQESLELFKASPHQFDLVITDMTMPGLTGNDLIKEIHRIRPDIPIILCTGYSDLFSEEDIKKMGVAKFLKKPINKETIAKAIREVLTTSSHH